MKKRLAFKCWNCNRKYTLFKEITDEQVLIVGCPYCDKEAVVRLDLYTQEKKSVLKGDANEDQVIGFEYEFPDLIPTQKPE